jgi:hypothetical protein
MTARQQLDLYLEQLQRRLRIRTTLRGAAILASAALVTTVVLVLIANALRFSGASLALSRIVLFAIIAACIAFACVMPLLRLTRRRSAWEAESLVPDFQHRLVTLAEREHEHQRENEGQGAFAELLAADTLKIAQRRAEVSQVVPNKKLLVSLGTALASVAVLLWIILAGPGFLGYGAALLWAGTTGAAPLYDLRVTPGDATVRRNSDQLISVQPRGVQTSDLRIYARYESTSKWDQLPMQPQAGTPNFQFLFAGLPEGVEYYVEAGELRSPHFHIRVTDVPAVKQIRVTYRFPSWTGIPTSTDDHGGDLHAIEGTDADLEITMDRPLTNGVLVLDDDHQVQLRAGANNLYTGTIHLEKDGAYHVAALDRGEQVRISEDYFINATKAGEPDVVIARPAGDYHASPIEEVTVQAKADDAFGLREFALHYSVNGGPDQTLNLLTKPGSKTADGSTVLRMEDFKAVPGDIVSLYATAKDAHAESRTDMFFIQAEPFERDYSQSQQAGGGGGGGGGGNAPDEISQRQKEIIGATWKQLGEKGGSSESAAQNAKFLSGVQAKLHDQAVSLANRLAMRGLDGGNEEFDAFQKNMNAAAAAMTPAADTLRNEKWKDSIPHEQQALQYLLRAEATFRQIQVAFGAAGGGGGAGGSAGRDLASLFDLELDTQKNQYESAQTGNSAAQQSEKVDEALRKLDELARREEQLAQQNNQNLTEQRWQQEMLRREAEELQKQIEQLTRNSGNSQSNSPNGQPSGQSSSSGGSSGSSSSSDPRVQQALNQLRQANEEMRRANSQGAPGQQGQADARDAAQRLRDAKNLLGGTQRQQHSGRLDSLAQEANRLANEQRSQSDRIRGMTPGSAGESAEEAANGPAGSSGRDTPQSLAEDRQKLADDLARLESQMRDAVRDLAGANRDAASKLRDALRQADQSDLDTRVQRSADMLRRGMSPDRNGSESQIGSDLQKMEQQTRDAQQALGNGGEQPGGSQQDALNQVQTLRDRLQQLERNSNSRGANGQNGAGNQPGQRGGQQPGQQPGQQSGPGGQNAGGASAFVNPGGGNASPIYGGMNSGNNIYNYGQMPSPPDGYANPAPQQAYRDSMAQLDQLRQSVKEDPDALREVQDLIREMQKLDPSRFPGNPAMIEELHNRVMADVDKLALEIRRTSEGKQSGQVHGTDSQPVPAGYEDAVADYFRRLSKTP